jgi:hypothetical protein
MGVRDATDARSKIPTREQKIEIGELMNISSYRVQDGGRSELRLTLPQLVADNHDIDTGDTVETYCDFSNGFLVIDLNGGTTNDA